MFKWLRRFRKGEPEPQPPEAVDLTPNVPHPLPRGGWPRVVDAFLDNAAAKHGHGGLYDRDDDEYDDWMSFAD